MHWTRILDAQHKLFAKAAPGHHPASASPAIRRAAADV